jgi:SHS2 domain-containing protein
MLEHTADVRARQLERYYQEALESRTNGVNRQSQLRRPKIGAAV